jgi:N-acetyl-gamma-glutamyl-phosphate reductase
MGASAAVLGASGYAGGELLRLLAQHPAIGVIAVVGGTRAGEPLGEVHPHLRGVLDLPVGSFQDTPLGADICFSCLPHGVLPDHLGAVESDLVVDLAEDFRAHPSWVYGLPEADRGSLAGATRIANPGCYPTASLLCLVPFARAGWLGDRVIIDALSGVSGAGRSARDGLLFSTLDGGASAYGTVAHRHIAEIEQGLHGFGEVVATVSFTPHLVPMSRGLLVTCRFEAPAGVSEDTALEVLHQAYGHEAFVQVIEGWPATKAVAGTNRAQVSARVDERGGYVICSCAIDNLGKGAAGQAIQNANLALGLEETAGLEAIAAWP